MVKHEVFENLTRVRLLKPIARLPDIRTRSGQAQDAEIRASLLRRVLTLLRRRLWLLIIVGMPSFLAVLYFGFIAADIYVSEPQFVVRSASQGRASAFGTILQEVGLTRSHDDTLSVHAFIMSRDAVQKLSREKDLRAILSRPEADFLRRFPGVMGGNSDEQLYQKYLHFVLVEFDPKTNISKLSVQAFRPEDAQAVATSLLAYGEEMINHMNERARQDALSVAQKEVDASEDRVVAVQARMTEYRVRENILDPEKQSAAALKLVAELSTQLAATEAQLAELSQSAPTSPQIPYLRDRIVAMQQQVALESGKLTGADGDTIVSKISGYEQLVLEQEFAVKALASAIASLETARLEAQRQQLYLERVISPNYPDYPLYPSRLRGILTVLLCSLVVYGIAWLLSAGIREHAGR
jgi:capsular polysaccharide transport system permease protein